MKVEANERGTIEQGFKRAEDGWHLVEFQEGITALTNKDDEEVFNKQGDALWKIPLKVNDADDISHEVDVDCIAGENSKGEQMIADFLGATGLWKKFAKKFPGDVSVFDDPIISKIKTSLPGQMMRIKTQQNEYKDKDGNDQVAVNIVGFGKVSDKVDELEETLFPGKGGASKTSGGSSNAKDTGAGSGSSSVDEDDDF